MEIKKIGFIFMVLMLTMLIAPVMAATPVPEPKMGEDGWVNPTGALYVSLMCHHNLISKDVLIYRIADDNKIFFVNGALVSKETYDMVPKMTDYPKTMKLNEGGQFDVFFSPGSYALKLNDGNGGQPEYALVTLYQGGRTDVVFIGHAVSFDHGKKQCVPDKTFTIVSAKYGALGQSCEDVSDNNAHTEYAYWITGTPAHTEYRYRDYIPDTFKEVCYPEINHKEYQIETYQIVVPAVPATPATGVKVDKEWYKVDGDWVYDYPLGHVHANKVSGTPIAPNRFQYNGHTYQITGSKWDDAFIVTPGTSEVPAEYGWVVTTPFTDGTCPSKVACLPEEPTTRCTERTVIDKEAYCEQIIDVPGHMGDWSVWSDEIPDKVEGREVETQFIPDDMTNGEYSEWSDTPEGSCIPQDASVVACIREEHEACITRDVPSTTHKECVDVGLYADVTTQVQKLADDGINSFVFDNRPSPGGIFSVTGSLLAELQDPAYGYVKTVEIVYNDGCSEDITVNGNEYDVITLGTLVPTPK